MGSDKVTLQWGVWLDRGSKRCLGKDDERTDLVRGQILSHPSLENTDRRSLVSRHNNSHHSYMGHRITPKVSSAPNPDLVIISSEGRMSPQLWVQFFKYKSLGADLLFQLLHPTPPSPPSSPKPSAGAMQVGRKARRDRLCTRTPVPRTRVLSGPGSFSVCTWRGLHAPSELRVQLWCLGCLLLADSLCWYLTALLAKFLEQELK